MVAKAEGTIAQTLARQRIRVTFSKDRMAALIVVKKPEPGEPEITIDEVMAALEAADVTHGIQQDIISKSISDKVYDTPIKIAVGDPAEKGKDTTFEYCFNTDIQGTPQEGKDGRIDYRDINLIQNVKKGAVLARKIPPTLGKNGRRVDGKEILAVRGRNIPFNNGANTKLSEDGLELIASIDGAIVFCRGAIEVKDVIFIDGDVDFSVGNIKCNGSVKVKGDIHAGFKLFVGGNLEVGGNVQDCHIICRGNILVKGGCFGKGEGSIHADGDIVIKYAQGQRISSGKEIIVGGELLNCRVTAKDRVWVKGKKGKIIGGEIKAGKEIRASVIGSDAGTPTVLKVAYDSSLMKEYHDMTCEVERLETDKDRVKESLYDLYKLQMDGKLTPPKAAALKKLEEFRDNVPHALKALHEKKLEIEERFQQFKDAVIIAEETMYIGVEAHFGVVYRQITETRNQCKLNLESNQVIFSEYRPT